MLYELNVHHSIEELKQMPSLPDEKKAVIIGERLVAARKNANLSAKMVCSLLSVKPQTLSTYEHGRLPPAILLARLCNLYNVSVDWILAGCSYQAALEAEEDKLLDGSLYLENITTLCNSARWLDYEITDISEDEAGNSFTVTLSHRNNYMLPLLQQLQDLQKVKGLLSSEDYTTLASQRMNQFKVSYSHALSEGLVDEYGNYVSEEDGTNTDE